MTKARRVFVGALSVLVLVGLAGTASAQGWGVPWEPGKTIAADLDSGTDVDEYLLAAVQGGVLSLKLTADKASGLVPALTIRDPDGALVDPGAALAVKGGKLQLKKFILLKSGSYVLLVASKNATGGSYSMTFKGKWPKGAAIKKQPWPADSVHDIPFLAVTGSSVKATLKSKGGHGFALLAVRDPTGGEVFNGASSFTFKGNSSAKGAFRVAQGTGEYVIRVQVGSDPVAFSAKVSVKATKGVKGLVQLPAEPRITSVDPVTGYPGETVTITGSNLTDPVLVLFGTRPVAPNDITYVSPTEIQVVVPANIAGTMDVTVGEPSGQANVLPNAFSLDSTPPQAEILFPPPAGVTDTATVHVTGTTEHVLPVVSVTVNGEAATSTSSGYATWTVEIPLAAGANAINVVTEDSTGNVGTFNGLGTITQVPPILRNAGDVYWEGDGGDVYVLDPGGRVLISIDAATNVRTKVSDFTAGAGMNSLDRMDIDPAGRRALVVGQVAGSRALTAVDLATGAVTVISNPTTAVGTGPAFGSFRGVEHDSTNGRVIISQSGPDEIIGVNLTTGNRTVLSNDVNGTGGLFTDNWDLAIDTAGTTAYVADGRVIWSVNLTSGNRTVLTDSISSGGTGTGPTNLSFRDVYYDGASNRLVAISEGGGKIITVDLSDGNRAQIGSFTDGGYHLTYDPAGQRVFGSTGLSAISEVAEVGGAETFLGTQSVGTGAQFDRPIGLCLDESNRRAFVSDYSQGVLYSVDLDTGNRTVVSGPGTGTGTDFFRLSGIDLDIASSRILAADEDQVFAVDMATGDRTVLADGTGGGGPGFVGLWALEYDSDSDTVYVFDDDTDTLLSVDGMSGDTAAVSGGAAGSGTAFNNPYGLAVDAAGAYAYIGDYSEKCLWQVDLADGARTILSKSPSPGSGAGFNFLYATGISPDGNTAYVVDWSGDTLFAVAVANGNRTRISQGGGTTYGSGPQLDGTLDMAVHSSGLVAYLSADSPETLMAIDLGSGDRVIVTR